MLQEINQTVLPEIGIKGQKKLLNSQVSIIGMGGLGCPVAQPKFR